MLEEVGRGGHSRQGNNVGRGQSAATALCLMREKCELCHCYFPSLAAWLVTADGKFPRKGTKFPLSLGFLGLHPSSLIRMFRLVTDLWMCSLQLGPVPFGREMQEHLMPLRLNSVQQTFS